MVLVRAVLDSSGLRLEWDAVRDSTTERLDRTYQEARLLWVEALKVDGREAAGRPPHMPGNLLARVIAAVFDEQGRDCRSLGGQAAGDESPWHSEWRYPAPQERSTRVTVQFSADGAPTRCVELLLS